MPRLHPGLRLGFNLLYTLLWCMAGPALFLWTRMRLGWKERLGLNLPGPAEIWVQGASAGECALVDSLVRHLPDCSILATTCTAQGREVLERIQDKQGLAIRMFPLDLPLLQRRMLECVRPRVVILLETEIWPGLLLSCAALAIPVVFINARMSSASLAGYLWLRPLLAACAPAAIGAISPADALRFRLVFGPVQTRVTGNIKFDRALGTPFLDRKDNPLAALIPQDAPFLVLGSVRQEEESMVLTLLQSLLTEQPDCVVGIFPRHMSRIQAWADRLAMARIPSVLRSELGTAATPGSVVLWDRFGELGMVYGLASRAFVGGSLARLGGQNFLEPLAQGVLPVVGPHTRNFDWVGDGIFENLVFRNADISKLAKELVKPAPSRPAVRDSALAYIRSRQGATAASAALIIHHFPRSSHA